MAPDQPASPEAPIVGFSHLQLVVTDLRASVDWYSAVLGLEHQAAGPGYIALRNRRARFLIVLSTAGAPGAPPPAGDQGPLDHLAFAVPDGDALADWAEHLGRIGVHHDGVASENGHPTLALRDPDGNAVELVAPRPAPS